MSQMERNKKKRKLEDIIRRTTQEINGTGIENNRIKQVIRGRKQSN